MEREIQELLPTCVKATRSHMSGHVTVGDQDIVRIHGRRGYVDGCVDVNLNQDLDDKVLPESEPKLGKRNTRWR